MSASPVTLPVDLEDLALELGASVHRPDGSVFNAAGRKGATRLRKVEPQQEPVAAQPAPQAQDNTQLLQALTQMLAAHQPQHAPAPVIHTPPAQVVVQPAARCSWEFTFTRNRDGTIQSITAIPKE